MLTSLMEVGEMKLMNFRGSRVLLPLAVTAVLLSICGLAAHVHRPLQTMSVASTTKGLGRDPRMAPDQALDLQFSQPGFHGIVHGIVGTPTVVALPNPDSPRFNLLATNFPFQVKSFVGTGPAPYSNGTTITLRVPGGELGTQGMRDADAPKISSSAELYVVVRDLAPFFVSHWGSNGNTILVAVDAADVFDVRNGLVHGQGSNASLAIPPAVFEQHAKR